MNETNTLMLHLPADILHDRVPDKVPEKEWPELFKELHAQMVYALPGESISALGLSGKDAGDYLKAVIRNRQIFHKLMKEQKCAFSLLESAGTPCCGAERCRRCHQLCPSREPVYGRYRPADFAG